MSEQGMRGRLCGRMATTLSLGVAVVLVSGCAFNRVFIPEVHKVHRGESLTSIAAAYDLNWRNLARWNDIDPPYNLRVGQRLSLDPFPPLNYGRMRRQRQAMRRQSGGMRQPRDVSPRATVTALPSGDGLSVAPLSTPQPVSGQQPSGSASKAPAVQPIPKNEPSLPQSDALGSTPAAAAGSAQPAMTANAGRVGASASGNDSTTSTQTDAPVDAPATNPPPLVSDAGWRWPLAASVLNAHKAKPIRHGLNLQGIKGTPVYAARDGQVVYSGVGLQGFGQLVIIKHDDNYLSAYGYVENVRVEEGDRIASGEHIADMGLGPGRQAMLHFEIRHEGESIDPQSVLPQR